MFYDNINKTLALGMNLQNQILLIQINPKYIKEEFYINYKNDEFKYGTKYSEYKIKQNYIIIVL